MAASGTGRHPADRTGPGDAAASQAHQSAQSPDATPDEPPADGAPAEDPDDEAATDDWPESGAAPADPVTRSPQTPQEQAAVDTAAEFARAFARAPTAEADAWHARISPFLSAQARHDYLGTDPAEVGYVVVGGPARLIESSDPEPYLSAVRLTTDGGTAVVSLVEDPRYPSGWAVRSIEVTP